VREKTPERVKTPAPEAAQAANHFGKALSSTFSVCCDFDAWATNGDACAMKTVPSDAAMERLRQS